MNIKPFICITTACFLAAGYSSAVAQTRLPLRNPGFEEGIKGWTIVDSGMSKVAAEAAYNAGGYGLRITDEADNGSSSVLSDAFPAKPGTTYGVTFWGRYLRGEGLAVSIVYYDADKNMLNSADKKNENMALIEKGATEWKQLKVEGVAPANAVTFRIWIHSFYTAMPVADVDEFELFEK